MLEEIDRCCERAIQMGAGIRESVQKLSHSHHLEGRNARGSVRTRAAWLSVAATVLAVVLRCGPTLAVTLHRSALPGTRWSVHTHPALGASSQIKLTTDVTLPSATLQHSSRKPHSPPQRLGTQDRQHGGRVGRAAFEVDQVPCRVQPESRHAKGQSAGHEKVCGQTTLGRVCWLTGFSDGSRAKSPTSSITRTTW